MPRTTRKERLALVGAGSHASSVVDLVESTNRFELLGFFENRDFDFKHLGHYSKIGTFDDLDYFDWSSAWFFLAIGQIGGPGIRDSLYKKLVSMGATSASLISPSSYVSPRASVGPGTGVFPGAVVNANATIGENCIINSLSLVEHDAVVGDGCHISTGARVNGSANIGGRSFVGSGAIIFQGVTLPEDSIVPAGAVVKA